MDDAKRELTKQKQQAFEARLKELQDVLSRITFEHRAAYRLDVILYGSDYALICQRHVPDSRDGKMIDVNNSQIVNAKTTDAAFVKLVFRAVGQFEAHEFAESFRYNGLHAYFPHNHENKMHALYNQGEALNQRLLNVWRDVENDRSDFAIAFRYFGTGLAALPVISHYIAFDRALTYKVRAMPYQIKKFIFNCKWRAKRWCLLKLDQLRDIMHDLKTRQAQFLHANSISEQSQNETKD